MDSEQKSREYPPLINSLGVEMRTREVSPEALERAAERRARGQLHGSHPNTIKNLHPLQKGCSGNPGGMPGRPKGSSVMGPILRRLAENPNEFGEGKEAVELADKFIGAMRAMAEGVESTKDGGTIRYDVYPILKIIEYTDGKPKQEIEHSGTTTQVTFKTTRSSDIPGRSESIEKSVRESISRRTESA